MAEANGGFSGRPFTLRMYVTQVSQNIAANTSDLAWSLLVISNSGYTSSNSSTSIWSGSIDGQPLSGVWTYDFSSTPAGGYLIIGSGTVTVSHTSDGTKSVAFSAYANGGSPLGEAGAGNSMGLTTIPRASTPTFTQDGSTLTTSIDAGTSVTVITNRASTSFTHNILYTFGSSSGTIATGVTDYASWTPPLSLLSNIPTSSSGSAQITVYTYSGSTLIGNKTVNLTLRVPTSVVPNFTTITHAEATTSPNVASLIGAYVKDQTKLAVAITDAAGIYGSTIKSYRIEVAGQTINAVSGTTSAIGQSGTLTLRGTITDSRNRTRTKDVTVTVLNYSVPAITSATAVRSTIGGSVDANGTYIKVDVAAVVQSLIVGTQKNNLTYRIRTRERTVSTPWTSITPDVNASAGSVAYADDNIIGPYSASNSYTVRVEIVDVLGSVSAIELTVSTGGTLLHLSKVVDGIGVGKYHEQGSVDAYGQMYQNNGLAVADRISVSLRNRVRNGNFSVNQRGVSSGASLTTNQFFLDGWRSLSTANAATWSGDDNGRVVTIPFGKEIRQTIERTDVPAGQWVLSWTGTAQMRIYKAGSTAPSYASGPILFTSDGSDNIRIEANAGTLSFVQLEGGVNPSPFENVPMSLRLLQCQRYYVRFAADATAEQFGPGFCPSTTVFNALIFFPVRMYATPTLDSSATSSFSVRSGGTVDATSIALSSGTTENIAVLDVGGTGFTAGQGGALRARTSPAYLGFAAEL